MLPVSFSALFPWGSEPWARPTASKLQGAPHLPTALKLQANVMRLAFYMYGYLGFELGALCLYRGAISLAQVCSLNQ